MSVLLEIILAGAVILPCDSAMWQLPEASFANPAIKQWMLPSSISMISSEHVNLRQNHATDIQRGNGEDYWKAGAEAYIHHGSSTLWGDASYSSGKQRAVAWNETADLDLIYPYVTADSMGGDISMEHYRIAGGYADRTGKFAWGAALSYDAGLYFRPIDPRPRNTTGTLDITAGAAMRIRNNYYGGISVDIRKYKQDSEIEFKDQTGEEKIYHLTGLGTRYRRFDGTGKECYYNGRRVGFTADIYPSDGRGLSISTGFRRFSFTKILTSLNRLPLAHAIHNETNLQCTWRHTGKKNDFGISASLGSYRRKGEENIFGDPSASVYPQIGSLPMYSDNATAASLSGLWQYRPSDGSTLFWLRTTAGYGRRCQKYADPSLKMQSENATINAYALLSYPFHGLWRATIAGGASASFPLQRTGCGEFEAVRNIGGSIRFGMQRRITSALEILLSGGWNHKSYFAADATARSNRYTISVSVIL